ncbi:hypothetical protein OF83DRAFT_580182 [Amylostereum chailletii]|nr:hypothetical protein OF83DRAFT_580182 [Amylostereum chailletii]
MLNNCELATIIGFSWYDNIEHTGTPPFMAIDLCCTDFWAGLVMRRYRHELEGEIWVLPWTHLQCDQTNAFESHPRLVPWTGDLDVARNVKGGMYADWGDYAPLAPWKNEWRLSFALCTMLHRTASARTEIKNDHWQYPDRYPKLEDVEKSTEEVYAELWAAVKRFYDSTADLEGYRELREGLCLSAD